VWSTEEVADWVGNLGETSGEVHVQVAARPVYSYPGVCRLSQGVFGVGTGRSDLMGFRWTSWQGTQVLPLPVRSGRYCPCVGKSNSKQASRKTVSSHST
jgi:hypothetical protein